MSNALPTIEDVLKKHAKNYKKTIEENEKSLYHLVLNGFEAINFAKEWASLQTPSNEKYWRERCEAAEELLKVMDIPKNRAGTANQQWELFGNRNDKWQRLKSTPIPLTPCGELEKEVERLKGLLHGQAYSVWKGCSSDLTFEEWYKLYQNNL